MLEQSLSAGKLSPQSKEPIPRDKISPNKAEQPTRNKPGIVFASYSPVAFTALKSSHSVDEFLITITDLMMLSVVSDM